LLQRPPTISVSTSSIVAGVLTLVGSVILVLLALNLISVLITVFLAIVLAETMRPAIAALERRGFPRKLAILLIYLSALAVVGGSIALIIPPLRDQLLALAHEAPILYQEARSQLPQLYELMTQLGVSAQIQMAISQIGSAVGPALRVVAAIPGQVLSGLLAILSGLVLGAFWIGFTERLDREAIGRLPIHRQYVIREIASELSSALGGWLRGQLVLMLFVGTLSFVGLLVLQVRYPVALAVWAGVTEIFPIVGPWVGAVPAVLVAAIESPAKGVAVFVLYVLVQQVENNFLVPKVMQRAVGLHPFVVLVSLLVGGTLLGIAGLIISVPLAAVGQVTLVRFWWSQVLRKERRQAAVEPLALETDGEPAAEREPRGVVLR
jgi:predicted PurR-regulated permease PerM